MVNGIPVGPEEVQALYQLLLGRYRIQILINKILSDI
jgi:hypothetical protein